MADKRRERVGQAGKAKTATRKTYVIAGDWVVDENWFLVRHYSELSKHTGEAHYRRLEAEDAGDRADKILDLCGAGLVARVLYLLPDLVEDSAAAMRHKQDELLAIGKWHQGDQTYLTHLVHSGPEDQPCTAGRPGYRILFPRICRYAPDGVTLHTIDPQAPTMRAVRLYHQHADGWHIVNRVDWEPPPGTLGEDIVGKLPDRKNVPIIIIDDLEKGAITKELVDRLLESYPTADWYVRAKDLNPKWLRVDDDSSSERFDRIKDKLVLWVIGPEVSPQLSPFECWHKRGRITQEAMQVLGAVSAKNVVLLTERREVIGKFKTAVSDDVVVWGRSELEPSVINQVGWADAVMAGLVHFLNQPSSWETVEDPNSFPILTEALKVADRFKGVTGVPKLSPHRDESVVLAQANARKTGIWPEEERKWNEARSRFGFIDNTTLEMWRASTPLAGYIACIPEKRAILEKIGRHLRPFRRGTNQRSLGIFIQADPGAGKSHLVRCLRTAFDYELLECDVSQMVQRKELFDFFDKVATRQVSCNKPVLAFVDEVNATLENSPVYGAFLAPLESNHYARWGQLHPIKPCIWLFAGTHMPAGDTNEKYGDFLSRMTLIERIDYGWLHRETDDAPGSANFRERRARKKPDADARRQEVSDAARLEQVYFGAAMIIQHFPDVTEVAEGILRAFWNLDPDRSPFRVIRQVASMLRNVRYGRIEMDNIAGVSVPGLDLDSVRTADSMVTLLLKPRFDAVRLDKSPHQAASPVAAETVGAQRRR